MVKCAFFLLLLFSLYINKEKRITDISGVTPDFHLVQKSDSGCADRGNTSLFFLPVILHAIQIHS